MRNLARWSMSLSGQKRRFDWRPVTSGLPLSTDILRGGRHVSNVPEAEVNGLPLAPKMGSGN